MAGYSRVFSIGTGYDRSRSTVEPKSSSIKRAVSFGAMWHTQDVPTFLRVRSLPEEQTVAEIQLNKLPRSPLATFTPSRTFYPRPQGIVDSVSSQSFVLGMLPAHPSLPPRWWYFSEVHSADMTCASLVRIKGSGYNAMIVSTCFAPEVSAKRL